MSSLLRLLNHSAPVGSVEIALPLQIVTRVSSREQLSGASASGINRTWWRGALTGDARRATIIKSIFTPTSVPAGVTHVDARFEIAEYTSGSHRFYRAIFRFTVDLPPTRDGAEVVLGDWSDIYLKSFSSGRSTTGTLLDTFNNGQLSGVQPRDIIPNEIVYVWDEGLRNGVDHRYSIELYDSAWQAASIPSVNSFIGIQITA